MFQQWDYIYKKTKKKQKQKSLHMFPTIMQFIPAYQKRKDGHKIPNKCQIHEIDL